MGCGRKRGVVYTTIYTLSLVGKRLLLMQANQHEMRRVELAVLIAQSFLFCDGVPVVVRQADGGV